MLLFRRKTESKEFYAFFKNVFGFTPRHTELFRIALTHRSLSTSHKGHRVNNERLEYLGDAVLSAVVADYLYRKYPLQGEGFLTELRSKIVSRASLNSLAKQIGLLDLIDYQRNQSGAFKSIGGDAFEALVGAIYLERGFNATKKLLVERILRTYVDVDTLASADWNFKSKLIDWGQKRHKKVSFEIVRTFTHGRDHRRQYESRVLIDGKPQQSAIEFSIKASEQLAAEKTYNALKSQGIIKQAQ
ncbi:MAG: ribonuclease III [Bacteroidales bacterium]|nr:ribonuclease III [Bacteroidales bacterium]